MVWRVLALEELSIHRGHIGQWDQGAVGTEKEGREGKLRLGALM